MSRNPMARESRSSAQAGASAPQFAGDAAGHASPRDAIVSDDTMPAIIELLVLGEWKMETRALSFADHRQTRQRPVMLEAATIMTRVKIMNLICQPVVITSTRGRPAAKR
jgi:hypothetical protein